MTTAAATHYRTLSFRDLDGSVTGIPDSHVMLHDGENDSVVTDDTCKIQPTWNASVCKGDIGRLNLSDSQRRTSARSQSRIADRPVRFAVFDRWRAVLQTTPLVQAQRAALFARRAPQAPIALVRNGKEFKISGDQSTVKAGTEIQVKTERPEVTLSLAEMDQGSWVIFELPGFTKAASGTEQRSMDALRQANETSYFRGGDALWVKLVARTSGHADYSSNGSASQHNGQPIRNRSVSESDVEPLIADLVLRGEPTGRTSVGRRRASFCRSLCVAAPCRSALPPGLRTVSRRLHLSYRGREP